LEGVTNTFSWMYFLFLIFFYHLIHV
jgi:hypothetical protein